MPPPFPRSHGYNNPRESQQLMPPPPTLPLPRDGVKKPSNNLESQLMPPPAVIPCEPPVTMRHVGDLMSSSLRQGKPKEEIGKEDEMIKRTCRAAAHVPEGSGQHSNWLNSIRSLQFGITRTVFVFLFLSSDQLILQFLWTHSRPLTGLDLTNNVQLFIQLWFTC